MKLFGISLGKEKVVPFPQFRDMVRLAVRRSAPGASIEATENGFILRMDGNPVSCNLRNLYASYSKSPEEKDAIIQAWLDSLVTEVPEHTWNEAQPTLRPMLRDINYIEQARKSLQREKTPDDLPAQHFVGELHAMVMREVGTTLTGVTQRQLDEWGISFEEVMRRALNNMGMMGFPQQTNALMAGATGKRGEGGEEVGLVFQGDHLTATWLLIERFRDHIAMRLQGDYVVAVPNRNRLTVVRADEPGLLASVLQTVRNFRSLPYPLTGQCFHVSSAMTGGVVTVYQAGGRTGEALDPSSPFAANATASPLAAPTLSASMPSRQAPVDLSKWGLTESTGDEQGSR